ncbi:murein DD-endopeptidase MepM/ murein hydrolase activator NlpD [Microbacterium phyllosphaerae]|uniref:Murein DD-endopeptidase MepM/ murein hydrolase activator NlpD n=1 Tax=Microbacterium phyllosphaerae TaxID=124798 RepID=A0ABS4WN54_9MICO|nr:M23 family metallopeptidase [Microbacterium phyllosphaerae]MBP2377635.1 murein DD-endopeptidase MepM/ murein hydrolase activator NlpD [Microbacterium phyllosphaerae]
MNDKHSTTDAAAAASDDCGCAPTAAESRAFWKNGSVSRRSAITLGALSVVALSAFGVSSGVTAAYAASYPSWDDVQNAMKNESAKASEVTRIEGLIQSLKQRVADAQAKAQLAGEEYNAAQLAYFDAIAVAEELQSQADAQAVVADDATTKAAQLAAQIYRNGGDDTALELFFAGSADNADELLSRLGTMDKVYQYNQTVHDNAVAARNSAQSLSDQAVVARTERDRLQQLAEQKMIEAQAAADAAQVALDEQSANLATMQAQLAALKSTTATTVASYKEGVRKAEEERKRREAAEAAAAAAGNGGGGGGGGTGGSAGTGGWVRPHGGHRSAGFGSRPRPCPACSAFHYGVDLANGCGAAIYAAHAGTVDYAGPNGNYGNYIRIQHGGGVASGYAHIRNGGFAVRNGSRVSAGQVIAYAGNTGASVGCHLHFEVYINGAYTNPITFLANRGISV